MNKLNHRILIVFFTLVTGMFLFSCVPQRKVVYMQDAKGIPTPTSYVNQAVEYRIHSGDYLYIRIFTMDRDANEIFSDMSGVSNYANLTDQNIYLNSYYVNDSGYINVPLLGKIKAGGLLVQDVEKAIYDVILQDVNNPGVVVRQVNFKITILGEVKNPGVYPINQKNVSILEAIAFAGDLTTYSNRNSVKLLRKNDANTEVINLDLTRKDILSSPYFFLRPGDVLYVEPLKYKQYAFESFPYSLLLSVLSTTLALITFFRI